MMCNFELGNLNSEKKHKTGCELSKKANLNIENCEKL